MKIATFNINSVGARIELLTQWLRTENPDVVLLQEIKTEYNAFPFFELQALGYDAKVLGQKSYNGVAVLSRHKIRVVSEGIPGFADENSRYLEVEVEDGGEAYRIASIYLPNGNPPANNPGDKSKLAYKLRWMEAFYNHARGLLLRHQPVILGGDFNVILTPGDVYDPGAFGIMPCFCRKCGGSCLLFCIWDIMTRFEPCIRSKTAIPTGITAAALFKMISGCGLIICCCRRRRRTGWPPAGLTGSFGSRTSRLTTRR